MRHAWLVVFCLSLGTPAAAEADRGDREDRPLSDWLQYNPYSFNSWNGQYWFNMGWDYYGLSGDRTLTFPLKFNDAGNPDAFELDCQAPNTPVGGFELTRGLTPVTTGTIRQRRLDNGDVMVTVKVTMDGMPVTVYLAPEVFACSAECGLNTEAYRCCADAGLQPVVLGTLRYDATLHMRLPGGGPIPWLLWLINANPLYRMHECACSGRCAPDHKYGVVGGTVTATGTGTVQLRAAEVPGLGLTPGATVRLVLQSRSVTELGDGWKGGLEVVRE